MMVIVNVMLSQIFFMQISTPTSSLISVWRTMTTIAVMKMTSDAIMPINVNVFDKLYSLSYNGVLSVSNFSGLLMRLQF